MTVKSVKGFRDTLPGESNVWRRVEERIRGAFHTWGFQEILLPFLERTELFARSLGETTEVVEKQMYSFQDLRGESLSLRPEGTASAVRAYIENHLDQGDPIVRLFYTGPMFRYERPQKGRYRQFNQMGIELIGDPSPEADAEVLSLLDYLLAHVGVTDVTLAINNLGHAGCRPAYLDALRGYLASSREDLCADCLRKAEQNPMRVLDCKVEACIAVAAGAPSILDHVCAECRAHFEAVRALLDLNGVKYVVDPRIVRGLDYYVRTAFEATSSRLGAQNAVAAGGRYDGLVKALGGPDVPGLGFAIGMERLLALLPEDADVPSDRPSVAMVGAGSNEARQAAFLLADRLRRSGVAVGWGGGRSLKSQLRRADKAGASYVIILGDEELEKDEVVLRDMRHQSQERVPRARVGDILLRRLGLDETVKG
ncbi:MAG: histidine--tRNA ligase [Deltaproteobacteria bacterium]|nr:histidine--tRNA ligase [Deltaproteobacteria bacterium]